MCIRDQKKNDEIILSFGVVSNYLKNNSNFAAVKSQYRISSHAPGSLKLNNSV